MPEQRNQGQASSINDGAWRPREVHRVKVAHRSRFVLDFAAGFRYGTAKVVIAAVVAATLSLQLGFTSQSWGAHDLEIVPQACCSGNVADGADTGSEHALPSGAGSGS
jgi:hypothetical protein